MACNHSPFQHSKSLDNTSFTLLDLKKRQETMQLYEWEDNSMFFYWNIANFKIPQDTTLRKQYLFDRCLIIEEETFLMNIYQRWFEVVHREIPIFRKMAMIHQASVENKIGNILFSLFFDQPEALQLLTQWDQKHPHIFLSQH